MKNNKSSGFAAFEISSILSHDLSTTIRFDGRFYMRNWLQLQLFQLRRNEQNVKSRNLFEHGTNFVPSLETMSNELPEIYYRYMLANPEHRQFTEIRNGDVSTKWIEWNLKNKFDFGDHNFERGKSFNW